MFAYVDIGLINIYHTMKIISGYTHYNNQIINQKYLLLGLDFLT